MVRSMYVTDEGGVAVLITVIARGCATTHPYNMISATVGVAQVATGMKVGKILKKIRKERHCAHADRECCNTPCK